MASSRRRSGLFALLAVLVVATGPARVVADDEDRKRLARHEDLVDWLQYQFNEALSQYLAWQAYADQYANTARPGLYEDFPQLTLLQQRIVGVVKISGPRRDEIVFWHRYWESRTRTLHAQLLEAIGRLPALRQKAQGGGNARAGGANGDPVPDRSSPFFARLDTNGDNSISKDEWMDSPPAKKDRRWATGIFSKMDKDRDDRLTIKEFEAFK